jgi:putative DNA primase/helicase
MSAVDLVSELLRPRRSLRDRLVSGDAILDVPPPRSLVGDLLQLDSLAAIYGQPGSCKSLLALDIGLSIASRRRWCGKDVIDGPVLYVVAEDTPGMGQRARAWRARHEHLGNVHWLLQRVPLLENDAIDELCEIVAEIAPALVVIDTLAKCMVGVEESSTREMGLAVDALDRLRSVINSCVCVVHHAGKDASRGMRGSNVLLGAADTTVECKRTREGVTAVVTKQRNGADGQRIHFALDPEGDSVVLVENESGTSVDAFRPTVLMERVSHYLESTTDANLRSVRTAISSKSEYVDLAVKCLIDEGFVTTKSGPRGARLHSSVTPFRDAEP